MAADSVPTAGYQVPAPGRPVRGDRYLGWPAMAVTVGLVASIVLDLLSVVMVPVGETALVRTVPSSIDARIVDIYTVFAIVGLLGLFATFGSFMLWSFRARASVEAWGIEGLDWGSGWAIGGWFIPFANFVIPKLVMDAIWSGTMAPLGTTTTRRRSSLLINGWWWTFVVSHVAGGAIGSTLFTPQDGLAVFVGYTAVIAVLSILSAVLAIVLVRRITHQQQARQAATLPVSGRPW